MWHCHISLVKKEYAGLITTYNSSAINDHVASLGNLKGGGVCGIYGCNVPCMFAKIIKYVLFFLLDNNLIACFFNYYIKF